MPPRGARAREHEARLEAVLCQAVQKIRSSSGEVSVKQVAQDYDVPYWTLRRRLQGETKPRSAAHTNQQLLTEAQERAFVDTNESLHILDPFVIS